MRECPFFKPSHSYNYSIWRPNLHCHFKLGYKTKIYSNGKIKLFASVIRKVCFQ